mmetsp:Transcript_27472/g.69872  ORF Transcript_27472/g.69872 Transcript_27472/m.69872 type:complete len:322 (-) Transcript_27472:825-1790(-)
MECRPRHQEGIPTAARGVGSCNGLGTTPGYTPRWAPRRPRDMGSATGHRKAYEWMVRLCLRRLRPPTEGAVGGGPDTTAWLALSVLGPAACLVTVLISLSSDRGTRGADPWFRPVLLLLPSARCGLLEWGAGLRPMLKGSGWPPVACGGSALATPGGRWGGDGVLGAPGTGDGEAGATAGCCGDGLACAVGSPPDMTDNWWPDEGPTEANSPVLDDRCPLGTLLVCEVSHMAASKACAGSISNSTNTLSATPMRSPLIASCFQAGSGGSNSVSCCACSTPSDSVTSTASASMTAPFAHVTHAPPGPYEMRVTAWLQRTSRP